MNKCHSFSLRCDKSEVTYRISINKQLREVTQLEHPSCGATLQSIVHSNLTCLKKEKFVPSVYNHWTVKGQICRSAPQCVKTLQSNHTQLCESIVPILSTYTLINLSTWYTFCQEKTYHSSVFRVSAILKFHYHVHHFINPHTNWKVNRLALLTSHMTPYNTPQLPPPPLSWFFQKYKIVETF
jgi:hypothetical protein